MEHNGIYEMARHHQGEIRDAVLRARLAERSGRERRSLSDRLRGARAALMAVLA